MFLVAGLAVAGLAGIAAAFYFSMRPRAARTRSAGSGRAAGPARDSRVPASRRRTAPPSSSRAADRTGASTVLDFTGPQQVLDDDPAPRRRPQEPDTEETEKAVARSHRRVGWRKGSDVDEELWPAEQFGGVSDEQFWDDLASDKPLATTARTAQPESATRRRPPNAGPLPDLYPAGGRSAPEGPGTHPQQRLEPDDRTVIQPAVPSSGTAPTATQPYPAVTPASAAAAVAPQPYTAATQPAPAMTRPSRAAGLPAAPRGRSRSAISPDEDPLTSPAYALRAQGSVDGRSGQPSTGGWYPEAAPSSRQFDRPAHGANGRGRPDPLRSDAYRPDPLRSDPVRSDAYRPDPLRSDAYRGDPLRSDPLRSDAYRADPLRSDRLRSEHLRPDPLRADRYRPDPLGPDNGQAGATHPYPQQSYGEPASPVSSPPYGERYGYGNPAGQPSPAADPRRANGAGLTGPGEGSWGSRPAQPPVNGYRGPYDPRGQDRRLTTRR